MATDLKSIITNANTTELELVARYAMRGEDPRRERAFSAFAATGLPHRRMEAWRWSDFRAALPMLEAPKGTPNADPFAALQGPVIEINASRYILPSDLPVGLRILERPDADAFSRAEEMPLGALTAALAGRKGAASGLAIEVTEPVAEPLRIIARSERAEANLARISVIVRPGAHIDLVESHLGGAGLSSFLLDFTLQEGASATRTLYQNGAGDEAQAITANIRSASAARYAQTALAFGARITRIETHLTHQETGSQAVLNAAYLAASGRHVDFTSHIRHGAEACTTRQLTKGAVLDGGRGIFQGKFMVPRGVGQRTDAAMQHHALLLEDGAEVFAKPELEIYADDVECAHGNTCGALDNNQLFYMRQRGIPEHEAKAMLTQAFVAEAFDQAPDFASEILLSTAQTWLGANKAIA
ncbi:MAG: SufD family Fe-S cluster assembly protein [Hyphomonadaceae bacterium]|nr:SufD family Fe-S cluster assembly protein [Hyphomonadaceae bacterium]